MPSRSPRPCGHPGCRVLVADGGNRCPAHAVKAWSKPADGPRRLTGRALQEARAALFRDEPTCRVCAAAGRVRLACWRDHIVPLAEGGTDDRENIQPLCTPCHDAKSQAERLRALRGSR